MSPRRMRLELALSLLLAAAASAPLASAICVPRKPPSGQSASSQPFVPKTAAPSPTTESLKPAPSSSASPDGKLTSAAPESDTPPASAAQLTSISDIIGKQAMGVLSPIIKTLCAKTDNPGLCESSIAELPTVPSVQLDAAGVLKLAMDAVREKVAEAIKVATDVMNDPKTDKVTAGVLDTCISSYKDLKGSLDDAEMALKSGDKGLLGTMLDTARTDVDTCEMSFEEREGLTPVMSSHDQLLAKLSSNCIAIAKAAGLL